MTYKKRYILIYTLLLTVLLAGGSITSMAQVTVRGSVYGGGNLADVGGSVEVNMRAGIVEKDVYGGGALANTNNYDPNEYEEVTVTVNQTVVTGLYTESNGVYTIVSTEGQKAQNNVTYYKKGAWVNRATTNTTTVNLLGGTIMGNAYGGGLGQIGTGEHYTQTEIDNAQEGDDAYGKTTGDWKTKPSDGEGAVKATVYGNITVQLGNSDGATKFNITEYDGKEIVKSGRVFGCNNLNGSPQGNVTVEVYKTVAGSQTHTRTTSENFENNRGKTPDATGYVTPTYEVAAVYGGGNLADYEPTASGKKASVIIETCDVSIESVYGGGNAAAVPETYVLVNGAYEIGELFGGGNGKDEYTLDGSSWSTNPGADVNGNATTLLKGGYIHEAYGGSNSKGTISGNVSIDKSSPGVDDETCPLTVIDLYGAGKDADIEGDLIMILGCSTTRTENIYGCAKNANVKGNVELTITSGEYGRVFGGNNVSGAIFGHIIVNIEEIGCSPIIIDELYGCGNDAAYSTYGYYHEQDPDTDEYLYIDEEKTKPRYKARASMTDHTAVTFEGKPHTVPPYADPEVNIISCTSIGKVFGGGYGSNATVYGNPKVNINMIKGVKAGTTYNSGDIPDQLGAVGGGETEDGVTFGVFGGGNQARVEGNTTVNIGTETKVYVVKTDVTGDVSGYYTYNEASYESASGTAEEGTTYYVKTGEVYSEIEIEAGETIPENCYTLSSEAGYGAASGTAVEGTIYYEEKPVLGANIAGNVYGGGNLADVTGNTFVNVCAKKNASDVYVGVAEGTEGVTIDGNVFGGGKGKADNFKCDKAMVGIEDAGEDIDTYPSGYPNGNTTVTINNGTVEGDVYGGGEIGRVEMNTTVTIGEAGNTSLTPIVQGHVFGAGKGEETHGYSALVRGNATVTIQGQAQVWQNVHGGGEKASVGRYQVAVTPALAAQYHVAMGMPCRLKAGGKCSVNIQDGATIGKDDIDESGDVYGAGQGVTPVHTYTAADTYTARMNNSKRMVNHVNYDSTTGTGHNPDSNHKGKTWDYYINEDTNEEDTRYVWEYYPDKEDYLRYVETLGRASETDVVIGGKRETTGESAGSITTSSAAPTIKGTVYGGSESGFVYKSTEVNIKQGEIDGDVFGGGKGLLTYSEAGRVRINTNLTISDGEIHGNVYGGGSLGDVGYITKNFTSYNYQWRKSDGSNSFNTTHNNGISGTNNNTGICNVTISGGEIGTGVDISDDGTFADGNVYGAGKGEANTFWCEKAMVFATNVSITAGTVHGTVYGGGKVGRVEDDAKVTIGGGASGPTIAGYVFGAGAGIKTHGYSALVRGNTDVTVQGSAQVGLSVYGGGETASVGRFNLDNRKLPKDPLSGGTCKVTVNGNAHIGTSGTGHNVFGACKGVEPDPSFGGNYDKAFKCMKTFATTPARDPNSSHPSWDYYVNDDGITDENYVWEYFADEDAYLEFLRTLALTSNTDVEIGGSATVNGSVYGGGERGITLGKVEVDIIGGTVTQDVYGGGALADTNTANWQNGALTSSYPYHEETSISRPSYVEIEVAAGESVEGLYTKDGDDYEDASGTADGETTYYEKLPGASTTGLYTRTGTEGNYTYTKIASTSATADASTDYFALYNTTVNLLGGIIGGNAYGGGLGRFKKGEQGDSDYESLVEAKVYGETKVNLNGMTVGEKSAAPTSIQALLATTAIDGNGDNDITDNDDDYYVVNSKGCIVNQVFGCNNQKGSPKGNVTVHVFATQNASKTVVGDKFINDNIDLTQGTSENDEAYLSRLKGIHAKEIALAAALDIDTESESYQIGESATVAQVKTAINGLIGVINDKTSAERNAVKYDMKAVYGGGNEAAYIPVYDEDTGDTDFKTQVIIEGCDYTSIETVYGGGNAASVPETNVMIKAAYEIETVFGGGNGNESTSHFDTNPGADIGIYKNASNQRVEYGTGNANTMITGGYIHAAYGGSNERGTVRGSVNLTAEAGTACDMLVKKMVSAGKNADIMGDAITVLGCMPNSWVEEYYGGADNANVHGNVELTITSGNFRQVFGGNNQGGIIMGHIKVNIQETGCIPINIDELYLGGNEAPYSYYGYYVKTKTDEENHTVLDLTTNGKLTFEPRESADDEHLAVKKMFTGPNDYEEYSAPTGDDPFISYDRQPELNIISCTRIGKVFGGGLGKTAVMYADPTVNINQIYGVSDGVTASTLGAVGANYVDKNGVNQTGGVFGGGNEARVEGNTTVNIGTKTKVYVVKTDVTGDVSSYYTYNEASYESASGTAEEGTTYYVKTGEVYSEIEIEAGETIPENCYTLSSEAGYGAASGTAVEGTIYYEEKPVLGANIAGNVYGGGNLADVGAYHEVDDPAWPGSKYVVIDATGNTNVNICAKYNPVTEKWESVAEGSEGVIIAGSVYGGGKGDEGTFTCEKAMVLGNKVGNPGGTNVRIGNGTVGTIVETTNAETGETVSTLIGGNVYGGGEIARVEQNTAVTIGFGPGAATGGTSNPDIRGSVFGAGAGLRTHGYSALVRGHSSVTVEGNAKIEQSVYGGGKLATVGRYYVKEGVAENNISGGACTVVIGGYAEIGPDNMLMHNTITGKPDDYGHVFGAGKGTQPYEGFEDTEQPWSKIPNVYDEETGAFVTDRTLYKRFGALIGNEKLPENYVKYLRTLALTTETEVTIKDHAFVKGCVFGGSENGFVQEDTHVTIQDDCQIGDGYVQMDDDGTYLSTKRSVNRRYTAKEWEKGRLFPDSDPDYTTDTELESLVSTDDGYYTSSLPECASWPYGQAANAADRYAPYDPNANTTGELGKYSNGNSTEGGRVIGDDGHTFYGSVFGGGSGYYPYKPGRWFVDAGAVYGDTYLTITGGHILTNVYGGNEMTDVGKFVLDSEGKPTTKIESGGKCTITMSGGTIGVPRTLNQIAAHPVTCYLFGAGKGDPRVFFNKSTNVGDVEVNITGGTIYGSVFGGGEDGHVLRDVKMTIEDDVTVTEGEEGEEPTTTINASPTIGTWGTSYVDGNVFGGGRGFTGDAYTAGNVAGSIKMEIKGGSILGSIYGGGRLGSVGYGLFESTNTTNYGVMQDDETDDTGTSTQYYKQGAVGLGRGHIDITISGGTIGNDYEYIIPDTTPDTGNAPEELENTDITKWTPAQWTAWKEHNNIPKTEFDTTTGRVSHTKGGNVFAGGMGNFLKQDGTYIGGGVNWWQFGCVKSTKLTITGGEIKSNVYGGGELGQVVGHHDIKDAEGHTVYTDENNTTPRVTSTEITIQGSSTIIGTKVEDASNNTQYTFGSVFGGGYGSLLDEIEVSGVTSKPKLIAGLVKEDTKIDMQAGKVRASIYGGGEMASVGETTTSGTTGSTFVAVSGGEVGIEPIIVSGTKRNFGGAKMGNVYGGGSGHNNTVRSGKIFKNSNVAISGGTIYHNVYGGGAYGTVGDFDYTEDPDENYKVVGVESLKTSGTGVATVTITGGTIGTDGNENGMVFGSSRGDIAAPGVRDDHCAWVYDTHVTIGEKNAETGAESGPAIKGSVYGGGENGHVFNNTVVTVNGGTIGIIDSSDPGYSISTYSGADYPYRGNVYGGGCGTDTYTYTTTERYDSNEDGEITDADDYAKAEAYNPLSGIVYGTTTVNINGGTVAHNVYGAGAMGSVGIIEKVEDEGDDEDSDDIIFISGGTTNINISGGQIGDDGDKDGDVYGAARGDKTTTQKDVALVQDTYITISSSGDVKGSVYGGGETGDVTNNTSVSMTGGTVRHNVFGGGKGANNLFTCEKAMVGIVEKGVTDHGEGADPRYTLLPGGTTVKITGGTVEGNVYGGGEIARVERNTSVTIGDVAETGTPIIQGSVFAAGAGLKTHGYSALVRGTSTVTVQGKAAVWHNVYGGGEKASVGRYKVKAKNNPLTPPDAPADLPVGMPYGLKAGGICSVIIQGNAKIGKDGLENSGNVFGAGQGIDPYENTYVYDSDDNLKPKRIQGDNTYEYFASEADYLQFIETLAISAKTDVTISGNAEVKGSVYGGSESGFVYLDTDVKVQNGTIDSNVYGGGKGLASYSEAGRVGDETKVTTTGGTMYGHVFGGGELGIVKNSVTVNISGGEMKQDVYGGGALANTNTACLDDIDKRGITTTVNLTGGTIDGDVYGGGLGQKIPSVIEAIVGGDVFVNLNGGEASTDENNCVVKSRIFGCNNLRGTPRGNVTVHVYRTEDWAGHGKSVNKNNSTYNVEAVYGGGNEAAYEPTDANPSSGTYYSYTYDEDDEVYKRDGGDGTTYAEKDLCKANVIIDGCDLSSIRWVYGGGNSAPTPATSVTVNGCHEIGTVFGGGNGADALSDGSPNLGANVGYRNYSYVDEDDGERKDYDNADTKENRRANYRYGTGKAETLLYGGTIHNAFGGSNTLGNVCSVAFSVLDQKSDCDLIVGELYGAGNQAFMDAKIELDMGCVAGLSELYGGAYAATVNEDVHLKLTSGKYDRVFGGNNQSGTINGSITVDVEETGCYPIIIGQLYGGGNVAPYPGADHRDDFEKKITVNVKSFTSIGTIFGGGYGRTAIVTGDTYVNVNEYNGLYYDLATTEDQTKSISGESVFLPGHKYGKIGSIGNIFGGGNAADVVGDTHINIGTEAALYEPVILIIPGTTDVSDYYTKDNSDNYTRATGVAQSGTDYYQQIVKMAVGNYQTVSVNVGDNVSGYYIRTGAGTESSPYDYTPATGTAQSGKTYCRKDPVVEYVKMPASADVRGYYYLTGAGTDDSPYIYNLVSGDSSVPAADNTTYYEENIVKGADIRYNVYGGGNDANVIGSTNVEIGRKATE